MSLKSRTRTKGGYISTVSSPYTITYTDASGNIGNANYPTGSFPSTYQSYDGSYIVDKVCYSANSLAKHQPYPNTLKYADPSFKAVSHHKRYSLRTKGSSPIDVKLTWPSTYRDGRFQVPSGSYYGFTISPSDTWVDMSSKGKVESKASGSGGSARVSHSTALVKMKEMLDDNSLLGFDEFSILSFVAELKDIRRLLDLFKVKYGNDKDLSDKFLNMNFGVLPLVGDVHSILKRLSKLPSSIELWNSIASRQGTMNSHRVLDSYENTFEYSTWSGYSTFGPFKYRTGYVTRGTIKTKMIGSVYFRPLPIEGDNYFALYRNIWGADSVLTAVWNFLPFSFVFDWFVDIGKAIDQFESSSPVLRTTILAAGYSVKQNYSAVSQDLIEINGVSYQLDSVNDTQSNYVRTEVSPAGLIEAGKYYNFGNYIGEVGYYQASLASSLLHLHFRS